MSPRLPDQTEIGTVSLRVADLGSTRDFYERVLGLVEIEPRREGPGEATRVALGAPEADRALVELIHTPDAPPRPRRSTGLFHLAILVPDRAELATSLARLTAAGHRLTGASDHLVSEALYLNDPEGNGIEIYRDRPVEEWRRNENGELAMATLPLDLDSLADERADGEDSDGRPPAAVSPGTRIGHVHLNVAELDEIERFYCSAIGFEPMVRSYPGALFIAAGGYHHHVGLNTWNGPGAPPPPEGSLGLAAFEVIVPEAADVEEVTSNLGAAGFDLELEIDGGHVIEARDPSGNTVRIVNSA